MPTREPLVLDLRPTSALVVLGALLAAFALLGVVQSVPGAMTKVAVGTLLALALDPVVVRVRRRLRVSRATAVALVGGVLTAVFAVMLVLLAPQAVEQAEDFARDLPATVRETYSWPVVGDRLAEADAAQKAEDFLEQLPGRIDDDALARGAEAVLGGLQTLSLILVIAIAVLIDGEALVGRARRLVRPNRRAHADDLGRIAYRTIGSYFAGSLTVAVLNGLVILSVGLALGVPLTPLAAVWASITNLIPQIGGFLGGSFFVLLAFTDSPLTGLIALVIFIVYQNIENHVIQPAIIGKRVNLSPPTTMLAAMIGGAAAGVPGALAATPVVGTVKAIYLELRGPPPEAQE
jgi:predicted PurR-regulated permease PerM